MSGVELAAKAGISRSQLSRIEHERHEPSPQSLKRIADALDVPVREIYRLEEELFGPKAGSPSRPWLLEQTAGRHAFLTMSSDEFKSYIRGLDAQGLQEVKEDVDLERSLIEHAFQRELHHPVGARVEIESELFRSLKVAWMNYVEALKDIDERRAQLRKEGNAEETRLVML